MRVFISHASQDKPAAEQLALALGQRGFDPWFDNWEIRAGDDIVASINAGLNASGAAVIVFSQHTRGNRWVENEISYLTWARIREHKPVIPVVVDGNSVIPPLLRPLAWRGIEEIEAIADGLRSRSAGPPSTRLGEQGRVERVVVALDRDVAGTVQVEVRAGGRIYARQSYPEMPRNLILAQEELFSGFGAGREKLGRELRAICLPGDSGDAVACLINNAPVGVTVEVCFETAGDGLLEIPFEAVLLPDGRSLATQPSAVVLCRPAGVEPPDRPPLAGPIKILAVVATPDEQYTGPTHLDRERELQNILDAIEIAQRRDNVQVRILEAGHPDAIGDALTSDAYHILHICCHVLPGALELEDEDGRAVPTTAARLVQVMQHSGHPLSMVLLNAAASNKTGYADPARFAEVLLRAGVPSVLVIRNSANEVRGAGLVRRFYENLTTREVLLPSQALAAARRDLAKEEENRCEPQEDSVQAHEYSGALFVAGEERPLANFGLDKQPLRIPPVYAVSGPVPRLRRDDLIGRRQELRAVLCALRADVCAGVLLTGLGGVGKSAIAGRAMERLIEAGWLIAAHAGRFDLARIAVSAGVALLKRNPELGAMLFKPELPDNVRFQLLEKALGEEALLLVLDDFEQNLEKGGGAFLDINVADLIRQLAKGASRGRMLITSRYPVPGAEAWLHRIRVGPLSPAESRKLVLRLPGLRSFEPEKVSAILRVIGGHPRMLEFLDAVLRGGEGRVPPVTEKLHKLLEHAPATGQLEDTVEAVLMAGARDVFLEELLSLACREGVDEFLLQTAVSNLPVAPASLARMLAGDAPGDEPAAARALEKLADLSLVHRFPDGAGWVHRWTAEGLSGLVDEAVHRERAIRAGRYRMWQVNTETGHLKDAIEAVRNFLSGKDFDNAVSCAKGCFTALKRFRQTAGIAALASEIFETLPETHPGFVDVADEEAFTQLALGRAGRACARYESVIGRQAQLASAESPQAEDLRRLCVLYEHSGQVHMQLRQFQQADRAFYQCLALAHRLVQMDPGNAEYQFLISVASERSGDVFDLVGQTGRALEMYLASLSFIKQLVQAEPARANYREHQSSVYNRVSDINLKLGQTQQAAEVHLRSLALAQRLNADEPENSNYQRHLADTLSRSAKICEALGKTTEAHDAYDLSITLLRRLAQMEPDRADHRIGLACALVNLSLTSSPPEATGLEQARSILESLLAEGRLPPGDLPKLTYLRKLQASAGS